MRRLRLSRAAEKELEEITAWLREHRTEQLAKQIFDQLVSAAMEIVELPEAWPVSRRDPRLRSRPIPRLRYAIVYQLTNTSVNIVAFAHMRRGSGYWRDRVK